MISPDYSSRLSDLSGLAAACTVSWWANRKVCRTRCITAVLRSSCPRLLQQNDVCREVLNIWLMGADFWRWHGFPGDNVGFSQRGEEQLGPLCHHKDNRQMEERNVNALRLTENKRKLIRTNVHLILSAFLFVGFPFLQVITFTVSDSGTHVAFLQALQTLWVTSCSPQNHNSSDEGVFVRFLAD